MKNKIITLLIICILLTCISLTIIYSSDVINSILFSISIWQNNLIPTLFPFFILSELLLQYGFVELTGNILKPIMEKFFHLPGECAFALIGSMVSGFPSGSKYTKDLVENRKITAEEGSYLLTFTHYSNPLFILGIIGILLLNSKKIGYIILICHYFSNFLVAIFFRPKEKVKSNSTSFNQILTEITDKRKKNISFVSHLTNAIFKTFKTLVLLLGIITFFLMITTILKKMLPFNDYFQCFIASLLEMTQGVYNVSYLPLSLELKASLIAFIISFGGISVHCQVASIISECKIKYKQFFKARILHGMLAFLLVYFSLIMFY